MYDWGSRHSTACCDRVDVHWIEVARQCRKSQLVISSETAVSEAYHHNQTSGAISLNKFQHSVNLRGLVTSCQPTLPGVSALRSIRRCCGSYGLLLPEGTSSLW